MDNEGDQWGKGFGTGTAIANLDFGFRKLGLEEIVGRSSSENTASIKILKKTGMTFRHTFNFNGQEGGWNPNTKQEFEQRNRNR